MKKLITLSLLLLLSIGFLTPISLFAFNDGDLLYILDNPNGYNTQSQDRFGFTMAMNDEYMIVGAPYEDDILGASNGKAYLVELSTGNVIYTFDNVNANNYTQGDYFSRDVAIGDDYISIGAYIEDLGSTSSGAIYIFSIDTGNLWRTILNPNVYGNNDDYFGLILAMHGDLLIVGVNNEDDSTGGSTGVAYVFDVYTGNLLYTLINPNVYGTSSSDNFGYSVEIHTNYMVVSTPLEDDIGGISSGVAYVYSTADGSLLYTITNPNDYGTTDSDNFGYASDINDDYLVVSSPYEDMNGYAQTGVVYVFDTITGSLLYTIDNPNIYGTPNSDNFGYSVALYDHYMVVGAVDEDYAGISSSGAVYVYDLSTNSLLYTYQKQDPSSSYTVYDLGFQTAISNGYIGASAPLSDDYATDTQTISGVVYVFQNTFNIIEHTVTFDSNGGSAISPIDVVDNNLLTPPTDPTKTDYVFERWYIDENLTIAFDFTDPITEDLTLYARWIESSGGGGVVSGGLTNNTAFMIVAIILYLSLLVIRFLSGVRVWNLFGIGILIYFIIQYSNIIPMVIVLVGFIIYQLYDTFIGGK